MTSGPPFIRRAWPGRRGAATEGFTLVEVMVALMIFGLIASAGVALLAFSVRAQGVTTARLDDLGGLARQSSLMAADLAQAIDRPARDDRGTRFPAFVGDAASVTFVRAGWTNIDAQPRSTLQKVSYRFADGALQRIAWPMVDGAAALPAATALGNVAGVTMRYRIGGAWSDNWTGAAGAALPQAVELSIQQRDGMVVRQLFLVGNGAPPRPKAPSPSPEVPDEQ